MLWWTVRQLKQQLTSDDSEMRRQAAQKLGEIKNPRAIDPLVAALKDKHRSVRLAAVRALGLIGNVYAQTKGLPVWKRALPVLSTSHQK